MSYSLNANLFAFHVSVNLGCTLLALASVEGQAVGVGLEGNNAALGKVENITSNGVDGLTGLIADVELALQDDLHLVVGISVNKGSSLLESVDATADGLLGVDLVIADNVAEEGVLVGDQGRLEFGLDFGEVGECWRGTHLFGC